MRNTNPSGSRARHHLFQKLFGSLFARTHTRTRSRKKAERVGPASSSLSLSLSSRARQTKKVNTLSPHPSFQRGKADLKGCFPLFRVLLASMNIGIVMPRETATANSVATLLV